MLQEAVHAFGRIHHRLGDDVGIAQRTDHVVTCGNDFSAANAHRDDR